MIVLRTQTVIVLLTATLIPSSLAFTYPTYNFPNYQRASRAGNYQYDRAPPTYYNGYRGNYDQNEPANYYVDDRNGQAVDREYYYGKPTYHGEYKPTRYYYARAPNYNYNDDHAELENPLDNLHEEMLQEDQRDRQRQMPVGQSQWLQNTGQPHSLTDNFIKNLMLYNDGYNPIERQSESSLSNGYDTNDNSDDIDEMYESLPTYDGGVAHEYANGMPASLSGQQTKHTLNDEPNQPYDYYDSLMENRPSHLKSSASQNQNDYFGNGNPDEYNYEHANKQPTYADYEDEPKVDKDEQDLKSLKLSTWDSSDNEKFDPFAANVKLSPLKSHNTFLSSHSGFEAGHKDYDDEEDGPWINWDRKRSLKQQRNDGFGPLKELEYRLTSLQKHANKLNQLKSATTTTTSAPSTSTIVRCEMIFNAQKLKL